MVIGSRQTLRDIPPIQIRFRGQTIHPVASTRNLGLIFDCHLTWDTHVDSLVQKCFGLLIALMHIRHHLPKNIIYDVVQCLVMSHVRYCISVYGNCSDKNHKKIQKIVNFCAKVVSGRRKFDHISDVLRGPGWLNSRQVANDHTLTLTHSILRKKQPTSLATLLQPNSSIHDRQTRQIDHIHLPRIRTEAGRRQFAYRAPSLHNTLPPNFAETRMGSLKKN